MAMNGSDVLLSVNTGTAELPEYTVVGAQRDVSFEEEMETIDISTKDSRASKIMAGRYSASVSLEALYVPTNSDYTALKTAFRNGDLIKIQRTEAGTATEIADALITGMSFDFPDQGEATISIDLEINGEWATA